MPAPGAGTFFDGGFTVCPPRRLAGAMLYRSYGKTQFQASRLGYGVMRLPVDEQHNVDMDKAVKVLRHAYDAGINIFDTHHNYHRSQSEEALGHAFAGVRDQVFIQTKNPFYRGESGGDTYRSRLEAALKRLQTDYVDGYMAHSVSQDSWEADGHGDAFVAAAAKFRDEGLVRFVGFSAHGTPEFIDKLIDTGQCDLVLFQYNLLDRAYEPCFAHAHARGVATGVMGPMAGGMLGPPTPEVAAMYPPGIASTPELCLRFVLSNENIDVAFSGMTQPEWIDQNAEVVSHLRPLGPADRKHLEAAVAEKKKLAELYCTACNYCMPCPHGVDIPRNFQFMNLHRLYGATEFARHRYSHLRTEGDPPLAASACTQCGECEPKCPQNISIVEQLQDVARTLGKGREVLRQR
ncbi:MAG TPA: aldo/keto reductase [Phycisphaerae bacterium]|nr:aldo/keto reductase [Phycisphaerae bacterium]